MDDKSFKMIPPLMREKDCERVGRPPTKIVLKSKPNINQNYWLWKIALHRFLCRDGRDDPKDAKED
jgi:hypothetical protein